MQPEIKPKTKSTLALIWIVFKRLGLKSMLNKSHLLMAACLLICVTIVSTLGFFAQGVKSTLNQDIAEFLGAPLVIRSDQPLPAEWWHSITDEDVVETVSLTHGAIGPGSYHSVAIKGVSNSYPLQGQLTLKTAAGDQSVKASQLNEAEAWLDARALSVLGARIGDMIQIGNSHFKVSEELTFEPDRLTQFQHTLPRVMLRSEDLPKTGIDLNNGRSEYRYLFAGTDQAIETIESALATTLSQYEHQVLKPDEGQHPFARMMMRAEKMLGLVMVLVLLLCGSGAAILADYSVKQYALPSTVLRCMGLPKVVVVYALLAQMACLALICGLAGGLIGWLVQPALASILMPYLKMAAVSFKYSIVMLSCAVSLVTLLIFVYPRMINLTDIPVVSVLRGQLDINRRLLLSTTIALVCLVSMLWYFSDNIRLTIYLCLGVLVLMLMALLFGWGLNKLIGHIHHLFHGPVRVVLRSIGRNPKKNVAPVVAVSLTVMALAMIMTLRGGFLDAYHVQRLHHDGNYIFSGLPADEAQPFNNFVEGKGATVKGMYPMVPAMLIAVNGINIDDAIQHESDTREETRSPVRLSWAADLPENNHLVSGDWPQLGSGDVSVEAEVMTDMGLQMGDQLTFKIGDQYLTSTISSQRKFKSGGSMVMFWFMFAPDTLAPYAQQRMGGIEINTEAKPMLSELGQQFPAALITDLAQQIESVRNIMVSITTVMNSLLVILLMAALPVLVAAVYISVDHHQNNVLRVFGLTKKRLQNMLMAEKTVVGMVSCTIGLVGAFIISQLMFKEQFGLPFQPDWLTWLMFLLFVPALYALIGAGMARNKLKQPVNTFQQL